MLKEKFILKHSANYGEDLGDIKTALQAKEEIIRLEEIEFLKKQLEKVKDNRGFVVQMGECAETFAQATYEDISARLNLINEFSRSIVSFSSILEDNIIKIGRIAGQYAKPRNEDFEEKNGIKLPIYKGDMVNGFDFQTDTRKHDAKRLLKAYDNAKYSAEIIKEVEKKQGQKIYISHEALILDYEESLTRESEIASHRVKYNSSAHMVWLGERTRFINSLHIEYLKTIDNPIGIKISENIKVEDLVEILKILNPMNEKGKIILINRMGAFAKKESLVKIIEFIKREGLEVLWFCDPMHGNTKKIKVGAKDYKIRYIENIKQEIHNFVEVLKGRDEYFAGIHLENTYKDVLECISMDEDTTKLKGNYESYCDPRLNANQSIDIAKYVASLL